MSYFPDSQAASLAIALLDDENSQAEGTMEGAIGGAIYGNLAPTAAPAPAPAAAAPPQPNHPHYENIYAPIGQPSNQANANAPANAEEAQPPQPAPTEANANATNNNNQSPPIAQPQQAQPQPQPQRILPMNNYRNDLYDRSGGGILGSNAAAAYDVPRAVRSGLGYRRNFRIDMQNGEN